MSEDLLNTLETILNIIFIVSGIALAVIPLIWDIKNPSMINPSVKFRQNRKVFTKAGKYFIVVVVIMLVSAAIKYFWDTHSNKEMQAEVMALRSEVKKEKINKKIQDYKRVLDISGQLSYTHLRWAIFEVKHKALNVYPTEQDYDEMFTERKRIMDLFTNRSDLIFDSSLNKQWRRSYFFPESYFIQKQIKADLLNGMSLAPDYHSTNAERIKENIKNDYEFFRVSDSISSAMIKSLDLYVNDKLVNLNKELSLIK